ncbi:unnamed protein product, partial [Amoebophrya sp. A120]|eukprot:GSA120T00009811001.1
MEKNQYYYQKMSGFCSSSSPTTTSSGMMVSSTGASELLFSKYQHQLDLKEIRRQKCLELVNLFPLKKIVTSRRQSSSSKSSSAGGYSNSSMRKNTNKSALVTISLANLSDEELHASGTSFVHQPLRMNLIQHIEEAVLYLFVLIPQLAN